MSSQCSQECVEIDTIKCWSVPALLNETLYPSTPFFILLQLTEITSA